MSALGLFDKTLGIMYNRRMSNMTDGKKALAAGEFDTAEKKLYKALEKRPDDSELWWCMMLCKCRFKNDDELEAGVKQKFAEAASAGKSVPPTPFDTTYCKNALSYATSTRRRDFVDRVNAELSELWREKSGKAYRPAKITQKRIYTQSDFLRVATYVAIALAAVGAGLAVFGVYDVSSVPLWAGFIVFILMSVTAAGLWYFTKRAGGDAKYAVGILTAVFFAACAALLFVGWITANKPVVQISAAMVVIVALVGIVRMAFKRRRGKTDRSGGSGGKKSASAPRAEYDRQAVAQAQKKHKHEKKQSTGDYEDSFD